MSLFRGALEAIKNDSVAVTILVSVVLAFAKYIATYLNARALARKKDRLELTNRQINEFYGPLYISTKAGEIAYQALITKIGRHDAFEKEDKPSPAELAEWYLWMKTVFMPLNEIREKVIIEKAHLIVEEQIPDCLLQFVTHVVAYKAVLAKWEKADFTERYSIIDFPEELGAYTAKSYARLKKQQAELLSKANFFETLVPVARLGTLLVVCPTRNSHRGAIHFPPPRGTRNVIFCWWVLSRSHSKHFKFLSKKFPLQVS
jgi:hypothetical protein